MEGFKYSWMTQEEVLRFTYASRAKGTEDDELCVNQNKISSFNVDLKTISECGDDDWSSDDGGWS